VAHAERSAAVVVEVAVKRGPSCGSSSRTDDPIRTGTGHSDRASRWKQLLVTVDDAIAALAVRLGREPASTLTGSLESAPATRGRRADEACRTSLRNSRPTGRKRRSIPGRVGQPGQTLGMLAWCVVSSDTARGEALALRTPPARLVRSGAYQGFAACIGRALRFQRHSGAGRLPCHLDMLLPSRSR
jgi:hypothetical protein